MKMAEFELKDYSMLQVLEDLTDNSITVKADGTYIDASGTSHSLTIFDWNYFKRNVLLNYRSRIITLWGEPHSAFPDLFSSWWNSRKDLFLKQAYAYTLKYNPIENYSSREQMTNDITTHLHGESVTRTHNDTVTTTPPGDTVTTTHPTKKEETTYPTEHKTETTPYNTTETTTYDARTDTHATKGFNSTNFNDVDKDTKAGSEVRSTTHPTITKETVSESYTGKETMEESYTGTDQVQTTHTQGTEAHTGTITDAHSGTDTDTRNYLLTKSGNIGIQTAAEMLQREYDGLMQDLANRALTELMDRYTFYSFSVE